MKKILLKSLKVKGFKNVKEEREFVFDNETILIGGNGAGKTTIADSIVWCLTGKLFDGIKNSVNFLNVESEVADVTLIIETEEGEISISRSIKKGGAKSTLKVNGKRNSQKKLTEMIDPNTFLMIFNPLVVLEKKPAEARSIITSLFDTENIDRKAIFDVLSEKHKNLLKKVDLNDTAEELRCIRKEISNKEKDLNFLNGYIEKKEEELERIVIEDKKELKEISKEIDEQINSLEEQLKGKKDLNKKINEKIMEKKYAISLKEREKFDNSKKIALEKEINSLRAEYSIKANRKYSPKNLLLVEKEISGYEGKINILKEENDNLKKEIMKIRGTKFKKGCTCPMCSSILDDEKTKVLKKTLKIKENEMLDKGVLNKTKIEDLENRLQVLLVGINSIKEEEIKNEEIFNTDKEKELELITSKAENLKEELEKENDLEKSFEEKKKNEISVLNNELIEMKKEEETLNEEIRCLNIEISKLKDIKIEEEKENIKINSFNNQVDKLIKMKKELEEEIKKDTIGVKNLSEEIEGLNLKMKTIILFNEKVVKAIEEKIKKSFNKVSFKIEKVDEITGEIKSCFEILYDNKKIETCSLSETVKAGIEISEMLMKNLDIDYPLFIDNSESITEVNPGVNQLIRTVVVDIKGIKSIDKKTLLNINESSRQIALNS